MKLYFPRIDICTERQNLTDEYIVVFSLSNKTGILRSIQMDFDNANWSLILELNGVDCYEINAKEYSSFDISSLSELTEETLVSSASKTFIHKFNNNHIMFNDSLKLKAKKLGTNTCRFCRSLVQYEEEVNMS